jgi:hypothetical protein
LVQGTPQPQTAITPVLEDDFAGGWPISDDSAQAQAGLDSQRMIEFFRAGNLGALDYNKEAVIDWSPDKERKQRLWRKEVNNT